MRKYVNVLFLKWLDYSIEMNNIMSEIPRSPVSRSYRDWATRIQIHGILQKKPLGHTSNKWTKRLVQKKLC